MAVAPQPTNLDNSGLVHDLGKDSVVVSSSNDVFNEEGGPVDLDEPYSVQRIEKVYRYIEIPPPPTLSTTESLTWLVGGSIRALSRPFGPCTSSARVSAPTSAWLKQ